MKRIWFTQQKPFDYMPLKAGLGLITEEELQEYQDKMNENALTCVGFLCPKVFTTRTRRLSGEYQVVQGSRFKAKPLDPPIQFQVTKTIPLDLREGYHLDGWNIAASATFKDLLSFPELDLGIKGTSFELLKDELLKLNKKSSIDTPFYVNRLKPIKSA